MTTRSFTHRRPWRRIGAAGGAVAALMLSMLMTPAGAAAPADSAAQTPIAAPPPSGAGGSTVDVASATSAPDQITWSIEPSSDTGPNGRVSFRYGVPAGDSLQDFVAVTNYSQRDVTFGLYASDGVTTQEGVFDLLPSSDTPIDSGSWVSLGASQVDVPAGGQVIVPFTLTVPADALPGDHPAGIVATVVTTAGSDGAPVSVERRVGARIHLRVDGDVTATLAVSGLQTTYDGGWDASATGTLELSFDVLNTGNVRLKGTVTVRVAGPLGVWDRTVQLSEIPEILPKFEYHVTTTLTDVPALVMLTPTIEVMPAAVGEDVIDVPMELATSQESRSWAMPWLWALIILAAVALASLGLQNRGRHRRKLALAVAAATAQAANPAAPAPATDPDAEPTDPVAD